MTQYAEKGVYEIGYMPYDQMSFERNGEKVFGKVTKMEGLALHGCPGRKSAESVQTQANFA
jgi:hypothetical protein